MSFGERRYRRYFEKADYGKFGNAIYDIVNKMIDDLARAFVDAKRYKEGD